MTKVFKLKRIKIDRRQNQVMVTVYGHASRGREARVGSFTTTPSLIKRDLAVFLNTAINLALPPIVDGPPA